MSEEEWRPVPGYGGRLEASSLGRIRTTRGRVLRQSANMHGYLHVLACYESNRTTVTVHRLVLTAFAGLRQTGQVARHLNGVKTDNRIANLAWGTQAENMQDQLRHGTHREARKTHCLNGHPLSGPNLQIVNSKQHGPYRRCKTCVREQRAKKASAA